MADPQQPGYLSTDPHAWTPAQATGGYLSTDPQAGQPEAAGGVEGFARAFWQRANPLSWASGLIEAAQHPVETAAQLVKADPQFLSQAKDAADHGDYLTAGRKVLSYLSMGLGHELDTQANLLQQGRYAEGAGAIAGTATSFLAPEAAAQAVGAIVPRVLAASRLTPANPAIADAVQFGQAHGVPVDAATATDHAGVRAVQHLADRSLGGAGVAGKAAQAEQQGLATLGQQLAAKGYPQAVTAEQAGQGLHDALVDRINTYDQTADAQYTKLRQLTEQAAQTRSPRPGQPFQSMAAPVDLRPVRAQLQPIYDRLLQERELAPSTIMGDKARALTALDTLMKAPDFAPLDTVDQALGDLKGLARGKANVLPALRTPGQGTAAAAVQALDGQVLKAAAQAGPEAVQALQAGRAATRAKYAVAQVYDAVRDEPVQAFNQAVAPKDSAIAQLRDVAKYAPAELPKIGRAYLDSLLNTATDAGGFAHADKLFADWQKLGDATKQTLFKDPAYIANLDRFFLLAKQMAKNANPSGTAHTMFALGQMTDAATGAAMGNLPMLGAAVASVGGSAALSTLLHSAAGVRLLTQGLTLPAGVSARAAWLARVAKQLGAVQGSVLTAQRSPSGVTP